jgi:predicted CoA-substrate-specific enzyme activase
MYLGIDVGSVSTKFAVIDENNNVVDSMYVRTGGDPISAVKRGLKEVGSKLLNKGEIEKVATTGSARYLVGILVNADIVKNEIICHAMGTLSFIPKARTIIDIGGQDSKIIIIRDGIPVDFSMNTVCAAGTGSFLDHQAARLGMPIEEFGEYAMRAKAKVNIAGRCTVFAESDMIHKQQSGFSKADIINGLCKAIVRNYLSNIAKGKEILSPVVFQGGVAANRGVKNAFEEELGLSVIVPKHYGVMGAIGAAVLAKEGAEQKKQKTNFNFNLAEIDFKTGSFDCDGCPNRCEVVEVSKNSVVVDRFGARCSRWEVGAENKSVNV